METSSIIVLVVAVVLAIYLIVIFNTLVANKNRIENAFSQIEVQLKRRYDLIPNLVETVKAYLSHERETLEAVIAARNAASQGLQAAHDSAASPEAIRNLMSAETNLTGALGRLNVVMEDYPDLKANENIAQLSEELTSTENRVAFARQAFNDSVMEYNTFKQSFPPVIFAGIFGHKEDAEMLVFADSAQIQDAPKVSF